MRIFELEVDLELIEAGRSAGFDQGFETEPPYCIAKTSFSAEGRSFYLWSRFTSFPDEASVRAWAQRFRGSSIAEWIREADGDYIIVVLDPVARQVHILDDRNGLYRAYFHRDGSRLLVSNSIRTIVRRMARARLSSYGVYQLLNAHRELAPHTVIEDLWMLEPGQIHSLTANDSHLATYHRGIDYKAIYCRTEGECLELLDATLRRVLIKRLLGRRAPLLFLSGGIDSAVLLKYLTELAQGEVHTISFGVENSLPEESELPQARATAEHMRSRHRELSLRPREFVKFFIRGVLESDCFYEGIQLTMPAQEMLEQDGVPYDVISGQDTRLHTPPVDRVLEFGLWINAHLAAQGRTGEFRVGSRWPDYFLERLLPRSTYIDYVLEQFLGFKDRSLNGVRDELFPRLRAAFPAFDPKDDRTTLMKKYTEGFMRLQFLHDANFLQTSLDCERLSLQMPFCEHEFVAACNRIPFHFGARTIFAFNNGRRYVPFCDKGLLRLLIKGFLPAEAVYRTKGAPNISHLFFNAAEFRSFMDDLLAKWAPDLVSALQGISRYLVEEELSWFAGKRRFVPQDAPRLRIVYNIAHLALLHQQCADRTFDLAGALADASQTSAQLKLAEFSSHRG